MLLLNGGMATRFGGRVKGVVDALPNRSFLALQASRLKALAADYEAERDRADKAEKLSTYTQVTF